MDELIKDAESGGVCQHVIAGILPCYEPGEYCYHCKRRYSKEHMRERHVNFSSYLVAYCVLCDAAIAAGQIQG